MSKSFLAAAAVVALAGCKSGSATPAGPPPVVVITTSMGVINVELDQQKAPISVQNFLSYTDKKFYDGTIFHRVIDQFMIQGGGMDAALVQKPTDRPIQNEAFNGLKNDRGTIAMARTALPNSATSQFYINVVNNGSLNSTPTSAGYAVFGHVIDGMDVVDRIKSTPTGTGKNGMPNMPITPVVIESIRRAG